MIEEYKALYEGGKGEIVEKKSRFICTVMPVSNEEDAITFIEKIKKEYWDATHNCFAYVIGEQNEIQRCSDDGEPSGTAGKPMLDVLVGEKVHNVAVVVTRYFGGTLLGTGGLVRAYSKATQEGLLQSLVITKSLGHQLEIITDYNGIGKLQYIIGQMQVTTLDTIYTDVVTLTVILKSDQKDEFVKKVIEATSAKAILNWKEEVYFAVIGGETLLF